MRPTYHFRPLFCCLRIPSCHFWRTVDLWRPLILELDCGFDEEQRSDPPRAATRVGSPATVFMQFLFFPALIRRFGTTPPASRASPPSTESDQGTLFASAYAAAGTTGRIEAVDSDGHLRSCPSNLGGIVWGRGNRSFCRLAGSRRIRVGSWNETKWKGSRAREGNGYKLWYSGSSIARNGVGIILAERHKDNVVRVTRRSDRIMAISVVIEGETVNVISAYAPHVGLRGDLNGHIGAAADGYAEVHGGVGFGDRNEEWCMSGGHNTQIDYLLVRRGDLKACKDCRAFPGEACSSQHRLIIVDVLLERLRHRREATGRPRILWKNLNGEAGVNEIYKIAKAREKRRRDIGNMKFIKDEGGRTIVREEDIRIRWGEYFSSLFNETPFEESRPEGSGEVGRYNSPTHFDCYYSRINHGEVRVALQKMGRNKAVGPDEIPIEAWRRYRVNRRVDGKVQSCPPRNGYPYQRPDQVLHRSGRIVNDVAHRIRVGWMKWRAASGVICDKRISLKLKGKFYKAAIRPAMLYGSECWPITKALAFRVEVAKLRMLKWTCGNTMVDMISNEVFRAALDVDSIIDKMREGRLRWFGHVKRRPQSVPVRRVEAMVVEGSRKRGRPKLRWEDRLKMDIKELRLSEDMTSDRNA
uniref:Reverse transcriptase domain-containing protein n=1 Tax=Tanacetum cinerariifolium TaxID=118510 RepID=A0A6L2LQF2_TANCI|nr:hypothetical protein [Tanacetum cinerariifolium]